MKKLGKFLSVVGPPGSGKSHFGRTAAAGRKGFVFAAPAGELLSYEGLELEREVVLDSGWLPSEGRYEATAFSKLLKKLRELEAAPPEVLLVDTMSSVADAVGHSVLAPFRTDNPQDLSNPFTFYVTFRSRMTELLNRLDYLRFEKGTDVVVMWHEDVKEVEGLGVQRREASKAGTQVHWDLAKVPLLPSSLRNDVAKWFDAHFYSEAVVGSKPFRCRLVAAPTASQLAKCRLPIMEKLQQLGEVPNDWKALERLWSPEQK